jgi:type III pantothenate kinase
MKVIIDKGNTVTKVHVFSNNDLLKSIEIVEKLDNLEIQIKKFLDPSSNFSAIISDVSNIYVDWKQIFKNATNLVFMSHKLIFPISIKYRTPETLGIDRIANMVGAWLIQPNQNNLVIDVGTCVKYDFINSDNCYLGGAISPGLTMRYKALNSYTGQLPLVKDTNSTVPLVGNSTIGSIESGVLNGTIAEINGIIERYNDDFENVNIILTGGDRMHFASILKSTIFVAPELTARGLNEILDLNL